MAKFTDLVLAILILIVGLYVLTKLGITWGGIWRMIHTFFSGSTTTNGTASSIAIGMAASNSKVRNKLRTREELRVRLQKFKECSSLITRRVRRRA